MVVWNSMLLEIITIPLVVVKQHVRFICLYFLRHYLFLKIQIYRELIYFRIKDCIICLRRAGFKTFSVIFVKCYCQFS